MFIRKKWKVIIKFKFSFIVKIVISFFFIFEKNWNILFLGIINFVVFGNK